MNQERVFQVLLGPHVSEKAAIVAEMNNQYVFRVAIDATKLEVKKAVEQLFKVNVADVTTLKVKGKVKRTLQSSGSFANAKELVQATSGFVCHQVFPFQGKSIRRIL